VRSLAPYRAACLIAMSAGADFARGVHRSMDAVSSSSVIGCGVLNAAVMPLRVESHTPAGVRSTSRSRAPAAPRMPITNPATLSPGSMIPVHVARANASRGFSAVLIAPIRGSTSDSERPNMLRRVSVWVGSAWSLVLPYRFWTSPKFRYAEQRRMEGGEQTGFTRPKARIVGGNKRQRRPRIGLQGGHPLGGPFVGAWK